MAPDGPVGPGHDGRTGVVLPDDPGGIGRTTRRPSLRRDAFWSALDAGVSGIFSLVTSFLVARLVGPQALGIGTAATALNVVLWVAVNALFADALVQQPELTEREASSAFWGSCLIGLGAAVLQAAVGWVLASMLDDQRLIGMALALALPLPLVGAAGVVQGLLTRERAYRRLALRTIFGQGLGSAVGIAGALAGLGPWAIVLQQALGATTGALALLLGRGWRPLAAFDRAALRRLLAIGLPLTGSTLVLIGRYRLFAVLIGASAGSTVLGEVHIAFRLVDTVRDLTSTALWRLLLPVLSPLQSDRKAMLAQVDRWMRLIGLVMLPVCAVLAFGLSHGVVRVMGPAWQSAGPAALPLVGLMAIGVLTFPASVALVAAGGVRIALYGHVASLLLTCAGVLLIPPSNAWQAVMVWCGSQILLLPYTLWTNARALGVGPLRPLFGLFMIVRPQIEALPAIRARAGS
ncbi:MAG TPA: oligosaccharide flippase family protein [Rhodopila sp.]|uniref:oligosaccharide flippase family protein n=1 Tax=Rhodopila sp. TaxID=2480087 RepID=UPI002C78D6AE|nr:oligosaccharide flippase family protein [Rhodopila sp.]HVY15914.1 oligosaccharide flippase family protein [Rhodopila sp.]